MKKGSILINIGRGNAVDPDALLSALREGPMMGAAIDVTEPEPLPADSPLWKCENLLITPHIAGQYHLQETLDNIAGICAGNLRRFINGEPLENPVDMTTGYKVSNS